MNASPALASKVTDAQQGSVVKWQDHEWTVAEPCTGQAGFWACLTHQEGFSNNMTVNSHVEDGRRHKLTWMCPDHGPEQAQ